MQMQRAESVMNEQQQTVWAIDVEDELDQALYAAELASTAIESINSQVPDHVIWAVYEVDRRMHALQARFNELKQHGVLRFMREAA
jgi:uncharacterized lipoprotein YmbA